MFASSIRATVLPSCKNSFRSLATLSIEQFGAPATVVKYNPAAATASAGDVTIKVNKAAVTVEDVNAIHGVSLSSSKLGVVGSAAIGVVTKVGAGAKGLSVNDKVLVNGSGVWADQVSVSASQAVKLPQLSDDQASLLPAFLSAWAILNSLKGLKTGETILQSDSNNAVGQAITSLGTALGYKIVNLTAADFADADFVAKYSKQGVTHAIAGAPGKDAFFMTKVICKAKGGSCTYYAGSSLPLDKVSGVDLPVGGAIFHDVSIKGFSYNSWAKDSAAVSQGLSVVGKLLAENKVTLKATTYPVSEFAKALGEVEKSGSYSTLKF